MNAKTFTKLGLAALMTVGLVGCGGDDKKSEAKSDKITVWAWDETFNIKAVNSAAEMYKKVDADTKVEVVTMAQDDIVQKLHTSLSSGKTDGLPDIVLIEDYKVQNYLTAYPDSFVELTDIVKEADFDDYKFSVNKVKDKIYGVPFDSGVAALFYRTDMIEEAGYTMKDMENLTWEKYIEIGKAVKAKTGKEMLTLDPNDIGQIRIMMQSAGSWYMKEDGETVNIKDNKALKDAIKVYKDMVDAGIVKQISDWDAFVSSFQQGDVASVPSGCWIGSSVKAAEDLSGKWAVTQIPRLGANDKSINASSIGGGGWYVINKGDMSKSVDFLKNTFASSADLMNTLAKDINLVSTLKSSKDTENYKAGNKYFSDQPIFKTMSEWSAQVPAVNYGLHTYAIEDVMTEAVQAVLAGTDIDTALENAQTQAEGAVVK